MGKPFLTYQPIHTCRRSSHHGILCATKRMAKPIPCLETRVMFTHTHLNGTQSVLAIRTPSQTLLPPCHLASRRGPGGIDSLPPTHASVWLRSQHSSTLSDHSPIIQSRVHPWFFTLSFPPMPIPFQLCGCSHRCFSLPPPFAIGPSP